MIALLHNRKFQLVFMLIFLGVLLVPGLFLDSTWDNGCHEPKLLP
jgi:hypothetical protein